MYKLHIILYSLYEERERQRQRQTDIDRDRDTESIHLKVVHTLVKRNDDERGLKSNNKNRQNRKKLRLLISYSYMGGGWGGGGCHAEGRVAGQARCLRFSPFWSILRPLRKPLSPGCLDVLPWLVDRGV